MVGGVGFQRLARDRQQRARHHQVGVAQQLRGTVGGVHAGQARHAGAAQQLQQHGFGLVVEVVGGQQEPRAVLRAHLAQRGVAQLAGGRFDAGFAFLQNHASVNRRSR